MKKTSISMKNEDFDVLKAFCEKEDISMSSLLRKAAKKFIEQEEKQ